MFRDLKEYQEIAKIYAEKVSKPENLEERRGSNLSQDQIAANRKGFVNRILTGNPEGKRPDMSGSNNRNTRGQALRMQREKNRPKTREEVGLPPKKKPSPFERKFGKERNEKRLIQSGLKKKIPTTAEIRAKNPNVVPGTRVNEVGAKGGGKPSSGDLSMFKDKKPEVSNLTKQGKPRTKAQMMAAKRIAAGKTISDVKAENQASMKAKAAERNQKFQAAKKSGNLKQFRKDNPKLSGKERAQQMAKDRLAKKAAMSEGAAAIPMVAGGIGKALGAGAAALGAAGMMMQSKKKQDTKSGQGFGGDKPANAEVKGKKKEKKPRLNIGKRASGRDRNFIQGGGYGSAESVEYDAYDIVLEYLLSTEQVATIEEANYVMTEMDAETIQGIVESQVNRADIIGGTKAAKNAAKGIGKYTPGPGVTKDFKLDPNFKLKGV